MNRLASALAATEALLPARRFAVVGGIAVSTRTEPRFTRDLDLAVSVPDDVSAEAIVRELLGRGFQLSAVIEQDRGGRLATVRLVAPGEPETGVARRGRGYASSPSAGSTADATWQRVSTAASSPG